MIPTSYPKIRLAFDLVKPDQIIRRQIVEPSSNSRRVNVGVLAMVLAWLLWNFYVWVKCLFR